MQCQLGSRTCTHTLADTPAIKYTQKCKTYIHAHIRHVSRTYPKHPRWSSSRHSYNVTNNSILDVRGSLRYEPAYLATKCITKKTQQKTDTSPHYILTICIPVSKFLYFIVADDL